MVIYAGLALSRGEDYTKDIKQIKNLYQEFITNYNKLNKVFELKDPIQINIIKDINYINILQH